MDAELTSFFILLSILWFLVYWILGGVFFAIMTVVRLGRLRKVRFSCLFSILALVLGIGAAYVGLQGSKEAVRDCLINAQGNAEKLVAVLGCGFASIFGTFLLGALLLTIGGFLVMAISKSKTKPWIILEPEEHPDEHQEASSQGHEGSSKFF